MVHEKKCSNCENMDICSMAHDLNTVMEPAIDNKWGFENIIDTIAHDCRKFRHFDE